MEKWYNVPQSTAWLAFKPADAANFLNSIAAAVEAGQRRRIVSIALDADSVAAVADDGTSWWLSGNGAKWTQLPALPDREVG